MKRWKILYLLILCCASLTAQDYTYSNLKSLLKDDGIETDDICIEKRTKNQISLRGGADYRIQVHENKKLSKYIKKRCYAVKKDTATYVNCKRLKFHKLRFGGWYAPAMVIDGNVYFRAIPLGTVAGQKQHNMDVTLGGPIGDAIATASLVSKRVYYEIDGVTGKVGLVNSKRLIELLGNREELIKQYKKEESDSANIVEKYLLLIRG